MTAETQQVSEKVKFWTCDDSAELLTATEIEEAVANWADDRDDPLPETVIVYGFAPNELPEAGWIADRVLGDLMELLDEEYGNQVDGTPTEVTPTLRTAALAFAEVVRREYSVWTCSIVTEETVRVADYYEPADAASEVSR